MTIRKIAQMGEPILRRRAAEVPAQAISSSAIQKLIDDMVVTMRDANGAGIAAPQVYESLRICVIEVDDNPRYPELEDVPLMVLINPVVKPLVPTNGGNLADGDSIGMYEGCLSVDGIRGLVRRPRRVEWTALDRSGRPIGGRWEGLSAAVIQHETDHLDGVLFVDRADPRTLCFLREYQRHVPSDERFCDGTARGAG